MAMIPAAMPLSESDYEAIESAVMETVRGRWFLAEYARRNRHADTEMLLNAINRIEQVISGERAAQSVDRIRFDLVDMAKAIARTKAEIAAMKPDADHQGKFGEATEELDSIVQATEQATSDILATAEQVQEIAWTMREQGVEAEVCDLLDAKATDIYTACSFQDLTGQRSRKVIQVLRYLEGRINAMIDIWGLDGAVTAETAEAEKARSGEQALLNGPARPGEGLDQADIDLVMGPAVRAAQVAAAMREDLAFIEIDVSDVETVELEPPATAEPTETLDLAPAPPLQPEPPLQSEPQPAAQAEPARPARTAADPLAPIMAMSDEERIALFT